MGLISFLEEHLFTCQWKATFGMECGGCGFQRSLILVLKGEFVEAFYMYPAIYTILLMFLYVGLHQKFNFKYGGKVLLSLFIINVVIIITNLLLKTF